MAYDYKKTNKAYEKPTLQSYFLMSGTYIWSRMSFHVCACVRASDWRDLRWPINFDRVPECRDWVHMTHVATVLRNHNFSGACHHNLRSTSSRYILTFFKWAAFDTGRRHCAEGVCLNISGLTGDLFTITAWSRQSIGDAA